MAILCFFYWGTVEYSRIVQIHLVAILIDAVNLMSRRSHIDVQELYGEMWMLQGGLSQRMTVGALSGPWVISRAYDHV